MKFLVKFDLEFDLKFEISDGKNLVKFGWRTFLPARRAPKISGRIRSKLRRKFRRTFRFKFRDFCRKLRSAEGRWLHGICRAWKPKHYKLQRRLWRHKPFASTLQHHWYLWMRHPHQCPAHRGDVLGTFWKTPLLRTPLLRTLLHCKTHSKTPSKNPFSDRFFFNCAKPIAKPLQRTPFFSGSRKRGGGGWV